jgi:aminoglycoside 6'-N-acetyltransferase I
LDLHVECWPSTTCTSAEAGERAFWEVAMTTDIRIRPAGPSDCIQLARLREALWPDSSVEEHVGELAPILEDTAAWAVPLIHLVAEASNRRLVGFLEVGLRSHADGCNPSRAVGFIEGWYVSEDRRHQGIGRKLLAAAEDWARSQGCMEMASDTWIDNEVSQRVHEALGYRVVDRCVHYRKPL